MNENEADTMRVEALGKLIDNAALDAINALPPAARPAMCQMLREAVAAAPEVRIVDDTPASSTKDGRA